ncbi:MAG TPA: nucleotidyltransferase domain-containing protein [Peptococcaceae bacterium]|nr:MAG: DNA polymerase beta domain protein region [Clostridia bacterium 41_269]HBT19929.1 nucleotidyltransferase domain-containing protein [Peptococcaceae bacterium]
MAGSAEKRKKILTEELKRIVSTAAEMGAEKIILFGSLARGDVGRESDIDLLIVKKTNKRFLDRLDEFYSRIQPRVAVDVLVYTPEELESLAETRRFVKEILAEGVVVYEKAR